MANDPDDDGIIGVNRDVEVGIEAYRGGKLAGSPAPRFYVTFSMDAASSSTLIGLLAANLKGLARLHVTDIRVPLPDVEDEPEADHAPTFTNSQGEAVLPHQFLASTEDDAKCTYCGAGASHPVHEGNRVENFTGIAAELMDALELERAEPADEAEAATREEAETALSSRSRHR